jgi:hypothetical protein
MLQCLRCKSQRVTKGRIIEPGGNSVAIFRPEGLRFLSFTAAGGTELEKECFACVDCGFVWTSVSAEKLEVFIRKHCDQTSDKPVA